MPKAIDWTSEMDAQLATLRDAVQRWSEIAVAMHLSRSTVIERGAKLGYFGRPVVAASGAPNEPEARATHGPDPLPAGHPISWNLLTAGTFLAGQPYG